MSDDTSSVYRVTIDGPGVHIERDVGETALPRVFAVLVNSPSGAVPSFYAAGDGNAPTKAPSVGNLNVDPAPGESIGEFLARLRARSNPPKIVAVGLYVQSSNQTPFFTAKDLRKGFVDAGETVPANLPRDLKLAAKTKWIARDPSESDRWYVTNTGRDLAAGAFQGLKRRVQLSTKHASQTVDVSASEGNGKRSRSTVGTAAQLGELLDEGYFKDGRTTQEIIDRLKERGLNVARTDLTQPLLTMVQTRPQKLKRSKTTRTGSARAIWEYSEG